MNHNSPPDLQSEQPEPTADPTGQSAVSVLRRPRFLAPLLVLGLAIFVRLAFVDVPRALAGWYWVGSITGGRANDYPCDDCPCPDGSDSDGDSDSGGGSDGQCSDCGMPSWWVSEPFMTVWLKDRPMSYQPSHGRPITFRMFFKSNPDSDSTYELNQAPVFGVGANWFTPWRLYLRSSSGSGDYSWLNGRGGLASSPVSCGIVCDYPYNYRDHTRLVTNSVPTINYPSGAYDVFGYSVTNSDYVRAFLTEKHDPEGNVTYFAWTTDGTTGAACLSSITDVDGNTTSFTYTNITTVATFTMLYRVTDPASHTTTLNYNQDGTEGGQPALTNIVDAAGLSSSFQYSGFSPTTSLTLTTPYGTRTFTVINTVNSSVAVSVNELGLRNHLYLYIDSDATQQITNSYASYVPSTAGFSNMFDSSDSDQRNSFHWGPRQYSMLSSNFVYFLTNNTCVTLTNLYTTNYIQARQRHWLIGTNDYGDSILGQTLSLQREPSPDGVTQGQITWYDYSGKTNAEYEGTMILPLLKAWKLPNGDSRFIRAERNVLGWPTRVIETYSDGSGNVVLRTNALTLASNNIDLLSVTNALNVRSVSNIFNGYHQVATNYNALGEPTVNTYDSSHRLVTTVTPSGLTASNYYGTDGYLKQSVDVEIARTNSYTWSQGLRATHTDERGLTLSFTWDGLNRLRKTSYPDSTYITNVYDKLDLVKVIDRMGLTNRYDYNGFRQRLHAVDALGRTNTYSYCDCGALNSITDPLGQSTSFTYDLAGRRTQTTYNADSFVVTENYDLMERLTNVSNSAGLSTTNWFNNQGLIVAVSNGVGRVSASIYDPLDRITNSIDANGVTVTNTYDDLGRLRTRGYPDGGIEKFGYSARGLVTYTNQIGASNFMVYNEAGRKLYETNANNELFQYAYDASGSLTNLIDGKSQSTIWHWDQYGQLTNKLDQAGTEILRYKYDPDGRLTNRWSAAKGDSFYSYDAVGNLTNINYPSSPDVALSYDGLNHLTNMVDASGTTVYCYNLAGQLLSEDGPFASDTVTYTYANRLRTALSLQQPTGSWTNGFGYDAALRLTNVTSQAGSFGYLYSGPGKLVSRIALPNTSFITNTFDGNARLLGTWLKNNSGTILDSATYGNNLANQRTSFTNAAGTNYQFTYDNIGQLTIADSADNGSKRGYAYDTAWNLHYRTNYLTLDTFTVDNKNELTNAPSPVNTLAYDSNGNLTSANNGVISYVYDDENRLIEWRSITAGGPVAGDRKTDLYYDGLGRLRARLEYSYVCTGGGGGGDGESAASFVGGDELPDSNGGGGGQTCSWQQSGAVYYIYDGFRVIQERDGNNTPLVSYTRGTDLSGTFEGAGGIGGLLGRSDGYSGGNWTGHTFYHADGSGNVTYLVDGSQGLAASYRYDPYGNILAASGSLAGPNVYRFSSKELLGNTGLYYFGYRFYNPNLQRWINRDPLEDGGSSAYIANHFGPGLTTQDGTTQIEEVEGANLFAFMDNAPLLYWDAFGLSKGGKQNISCEGFTKNSDPIKVKEAMDAAKEAGKLKSYRKLRGLLKVIKRGGTMISLFIDFLLEEINNPLVSGSGDLEA